MCMDGKEYEIPLNCKVKGRLVSLRYKWYALAFLNLTKLINVINKL